MVCTPLGCYDYIGKHITFVVKNYCDKSKSAVIEFQQNVFLKEDVQMPNVFRSEFFPIHVR